MSGSGSLASRNVDSIAVPSAGLTTSVTAYTSGDQLGTELTVTLARSTAMLRSVAITDASAAAGGIDLFFFDRASTPAADNAANSWADADIAHLLWFQSFAALTVSALNSFAVIGGLAVPLKANASSQVFLNLVTRSAHAVFAAVTDVTVHLGVEYL